MSHEPEIAILLPFKERFGRDCAGAIALCVRDATLASRHRERVTVFGPPLPAPFAGVAYHALEPTWGGLAGANLGLAEALSRHLEGRRDVVVEVHNRPRVFLYLAARTRLALTLHLHNDPQTMAWARRRASRRRILARAEAVYCVSDYVRQRFLDGIGDDAGKVHVLINGIARDAGAPPPKEPTILYVGRIVEEKGAGILLAALERVLPRHPGWRALVVGAERPGGSNGSVSAYEQRLRARSAASGGAITCTGFLPHDHVVEHFRRAAVAVVPSLWPEPLSRAAIEGLASGCAVIAFARGGLPEVVGGRGLLVNETTPEALAGALERVVGDDGLRAALQERAWRDFPFEIGRVAAQQDAIRDAVLARLNGAG